MTDETRQTGTPRDIDRAQDATGSIGGKACASKRGDSSSAFVNNAMLGDLYEIQAAELALSRDAPELQSLARTIRDDHRQNSQRLISAVKSASSDFDIPAQLDDRRRGMIDNLRKAPDDVFEDTFLRQQVVSHEEAVELYRTYYLNGESDALRDFAEETLPVLESHLKLVQGRWNGSSPIP